MVVAVVAMRMVQVPGNMIIDMIAVRHRFMAAARAMGMIGFVAAAAMIRAAVIRIAAGDADHMLVDMAFVGGEDDRHASSRCDRRGARPSARNRAHADERVPGGLVPDKWSLLIILSAPGSRRHRGAALGRVIDRIAHQRKYVLVGEGIENMLGFASTPYKPHGVKSLQARGHSCNFFPFLFGQLRDACLALGKPHQELQSLGIAKCSKHRRDNFHLGPRRHLHRGPGRMPLMHLFGSNSVVIRLFHQSLEYRIEDSDARILAEGGSSLRRWWSYSAAISARQPRCFRHR